MILAVTLTIRHDDGTVHEYDVSPDDVHQTCGEGCVSIDAICDDPVVRPRFTPGARVRIRRSPTQTYTIVDGEVEVVPNGEPVVRLRRRSGSVFVAPVSQVYPADRRGP